MPLCDPRGPSAPPLPIMPPVMPRLSESPLLRPPKSPLRWLVDVSPCKAGSRSGRRSGLSGSPIAQSLWLSKDVHGRTRSESPISASCRADVDCAFAAPALRQRRTLIAAKRILIFQLHRWDYRMYMWEQVSLGRSCHVVAGLCVALRSEAVPTADSPAVVPAARAPSADEH